jgi:DNA polymerase-3 subunit beta
MEQIIEVQTSVLKAALTHAAKDDVRYYLEGVFFDMTSGHVVATDGHRMFVARLAADTWRPGASFIVPAAIIKVAVSSAGRKQDMIRVAATVTDSGGSVMLDKIGGELIDGRFPDWRRVVPAHTDGTIGHFNPDYLSAAFDAIATATMATVRKGSAPPALLHYNGTMPAVVTSLDGASVFCIVMPTRAESGDAADILAGVLEPALPSESVAA